MLVYFALGNAKIWRRVNCPTPASDARYFAFWWNIGLTQKIPTCWYLWRWVKQIFGVLPDAKPKICISPDANPRRQSVEYRWRWASGVGAGVGHVHFMFFVLISCAFCSQRKPIFRWNMGFKLFQKLYLILRYQIVCSRRKSKIPIFHNMFFNFDILLNISNRASKSEMYDFCNVLEESVYQFCFI